MKCFNCNLEIIDDGFYLRLEKSFDGYRWHDRVLSCFLCVGQLIQLGICSRMPPNERSRPLNRSDSVESSPIRFDSNGAIKTNPRIRGVSWIVRKRMIDRMKN